MKVFGKTIYRMDLVWKLGLMDQSMKETIKKERNMAQVPIHGPMDLNMLEIGWKTEFQEREPIPGLMVESMKDNG